MIKKILKGGIYLAGCLLILAMGSLLYFRWETNNREVKTNREIAPETGRYVSADDTQIFIQESGPIDGEPLLFIHGTGAWGEIWRETADPLNAAGYHTILVDLTPFGFSDRPSNQVYDQASQAKRLLGVIESLEVETITLVGHSFGGGPTVETALSAPEKIERLILLDVGNLVGPLPFEDRSTEPGAVAKIASISPLRNSVLSALVTNPRMSRRLLQTLIHDPANATDARVEMLQRPMPIENSTHDFGLWLVENFLMPHPEFKANDPANYAVLDMPVLIIWGAEDTLTPLEQGEYMHEVIAGSELQIFEGVGHVPQVEDPDKLVDALLIFLAETSGD